MPTLREIITSHVNKNVDVMNLSLGNVAVTPRGKDDLKREFNPKGYQLQFQRTWEGLQLTIKKVASIVEANPHTA